MRDVLNKFVYAFWVFIMILGVLRFIGVIPSYTKCDCNDISEEVISDEIDPTYAEKVEKICRRYIELWEQDLELYNLISENNTQMYQDLNIRIKTRMNDIADSYNEYLSRNEYVFNGTLPDGIYAAIERIED